MDNQALRCYGTGSLMLQSAGELMTGWLFTASLTLRQVLLRRFWSLDLHWSSPWPSVSISWPPPCWQHRLSLLKPLLFSPEVEKLSESLSQLSRRQIGLVSVTLQSGLWKSGSVLCAEFDRQAAQRASETAGARA